jgi:hypothetical protein
MIWRCACGRPNLESHIRCIDCGESRPSGEHDFEEGDAMDEEPQGYLETQEAWEEPSPPSWEPVKSPRQPEHGFVGRALRRTLFHYRRVLGPFLPGFIFIVIPIQIGYLHLANAVVAGKAASLSTIGVSAVLTLLVTLASYYIIILTAFSVRDESIAMGPFYTQVPWSTLGVLWLATVAYGLAIFFGFFLFVIPGLAAMTLLSLVQPLVVLDRASVAEALRASPRLVIGRGGIQALQVFSVILLIELVLTALSFLALAPVSTWVSRMVSPFLGQVFEVGVGGLLFPFHAVVLTILYDELVGIPLPKSSH